MNKKQKKMLIRIIVAAVLIVLFSKLPIDGYVRFGLFMIPYLVIGYDILQKAFKVQSNINRMKQKQQTACIECGMCDHCSNLFLCHTMIFCILKMIF